MGVYTIAVWNLLLFWVDIREQGLDFQWGDPASIIK